VSKHKPAFGLSTSLMISWVLFHVGACVDQAQGS
jgi:hypothetical protein